MSHPKLDMDRSKVLAYEEEFDGFELKLVDDDGEIKRYQMSPTELAALRWALTDVEQRVHMSDQNGYSYSVTEDI
jgi:hypothetical protein